MKWSFLKKFNVNILLVKHMNALACLNMVSGDSNKGDWLFQYLSLAIACGNAASILNLVVCGQLNY